ncbi:MAG: hypothetical protein AAGC72_15020 [Planctomycetota bacterium]
MAISTTTIDNLPDYTDAQMVKLCKYAISQILGGAQSYSINGRTFTGADLDKLRAMLSFYEDRFESDTNGGENIALVEFRGP